MEFQGFGKIPRLNRGIVITEKIDGTNACIVIHTLEHEGDYDDDYTALVQRDGVWYALYCQSRKRVIRPNDVGGKGSDNFGFAAWVRDHAEELTFLGEGRHYGEWFGGGIQRGYGLQGGGEPERRFALFNTKRWSDNAAAEHGERPDCCTVVPVLRQWGQFDSEVIKVTLADLAEVGSYAVPGYPDPEGIVVYHTAANQMFKVTIEDDAVPKSVAASVIVNNAPPDPLRLPPLQGTGGGSTGTAGMVAA